MTSRDKLVKKEARDRRSFIELTIEPITGLSFIVDVMGVDTILDLKQIIEITQGIQSDKQHLVWRSLELQDMETLNSYGIQDGATIQLIPAMRGGPISMRYIEPESSRPSASDEQLALDLAELLTETTPDGRHSNKHAIIVIVYSSDQQFHFIRLIDDDSMDSTPTDTETSSSSLLAKGEKDDQPNQKSQHTIENEVTQERMLQLRKNMDNKSMRKKTLQTSESQPESQSHDATIPSKNSLPTASSLLIPVGSKVTRANVTDSTRSSEMSLTGACTRPSTGGHASPKSINSRTDKYIMKTTAVVMPSPGSQSPHAPGGTFGGMSVRSPHRHTPGALSPLHPVGRAQSPHWPSYPVQPAVYRNTSSTVRVPTVQDSHQTTTKHTDAGARLNANPSGSKVCARPHKNIPLKSNTDKVVSDTAANRKDGSDTVVPCLSADSSSWRIQSTSSIRMSLTNALSSTINAVLTGRHSSEPTNTLNSNYLLIQSSDQLIPLNTRQLSASTLARSFNDIVTTTKDQGGHSSLEKIGLGNPNRCAICRKKTGLTTSFLCRCGGTFCTEHRYPEEHACTVDYKAEGRKTIEHDNPVVQAPKLPKI